MNQKSESPSTGQRDAAANNAQYENLIEEIKELRRQIFSKDAVPSRKPSAQLMQVLRDAVSGGALVPGKDDALNGKAAVRTDRDKDEIRTQLVAAETRAAQSLARQAALEEELQSYQKYMKEIVPQYQRQIQALQNELQKRKRADAPTKPAQPTQDKVSEGKLPPITNGAANKA